MGIDHIIKGKLQQKKLNQDIQEVLGLYPELDVLYKNQRPTKIHGVFRLFDNYNVEQGNWIIAIKIPSEYPYAFPELYELSDKIERSEDTHIADDGKVCLELDIIANYIAKNKGITLLTFINNYVIKYFCWILLYTSGYKEELEFWKHNLDGYKQFLYERLDTFDDLLVLKCLDIITDNNLPSRNDLCFCGSGKKYKHCHARKIESIGIFDHKVLQFFKALFKNSTKH